MVNVNLIAKVKKERKVKVTFVYSLFKYTR